MLKIILKNELKILKLYFNIDNKLEKLITI